MATNERFAVAAIDFGTTFSSWAFSFNHQIKSKPPKFTISKWEGTKHISKKTPTSVLIKPDGKTFHSFGFEAENKYAELAELDEHDEWYFFRRFKMMLFSELNLSREVLLEDDQGHMLPALTIFRMAIQYLKELTITEISNQITESVSDDQVHWVITVPAIWNDTAKQFMEDAAVEAGIPAKKLQIVLEPEVASVYCKTVQINLTKELAMTTFQEDYKYILFDAGGGTADITVHEVGKDGSLNELHEVSGGNWGGTKVDEAFKQLLIDVFGDKVISRFQRECTNDYLQLFYEFEIKKREVDPRYEGNTDFDINALKSIVLEERNISLEEAVEMSGYSKTIKILRKYKLRLSAGIMQSLFNEVIADAMTHLKSLQEELKSKAININAIILVGGFSESKMLQDGIREALPDMKLINPPDAGLAVIKGAVLYGFHPKITTRKCRYCYGWEIEETFVVGLHKPEYAQPRFGKPLMCTNLFHHAVYKGNSLKCGEDKVKASFRPVSDDADYLFLKLYAATSNSVKYVTDADCHRVCTICVEVTDKEGPAYGRPFKVTMDFSQTKIHITAKETATKKLTKVSVDYYAS